MSIPTPRYLASFHPKQVPHFFTDIFVVGSGLAGLRAALGVDRNLSVLVVTKGELQLSNRAYAQGGIAAVLGTEDRFEDHATFSASGRGCAIPGTFQAGKPPLLVSLQDKEIGNEQEQLG
jgi:L-aspartate oxidase